MSTNNITHRYRKHYKARKDIKSWEVLALSDIWLHQFLENFTRTKFKLLIHAAFNPMKISFVLNEEMGLSL